MEEVVFTGVMYNANYSIRWRIKVVQVSPKRFDVREIEPGLFPTPLASGFTLRQALDAFFETEKELIHTNYLKKTS